MKYSCRHSFKWKSRINSSAGVGEVCQLMSVACKTHQQKQSWLFRQWPVSQEQCCNCYKRTQLKSQITQNISTLFSSGRFLLWLEGLWNWCNLAEPSGDKCRLLRETKPSCHRWLSSCYFLWVSALTAPGFPLQTCRSTSWKPESKYFCTPVARTHS